nr:NBS-LRR type disease resistance protein [Ipomoea batatas]
MEQIFSFGSKMVGEYMGFDENLETLNVEVDQLYEQANDIKAELMNIERGGQRKRKREVESWLQQVEQLKKHFETFKESIQGRGLIMKNAWKLIKAQQLERMTERVKKLRDEGRNISELTLNFLKILTSENYKITLQKLLYIRISDDENEEQRAAILANYFVGNNVVLILDNIGCQKLLKVNVLNEEEAWNLFKEILVQDDHTVLTDAIENHAKELAKKCGGLPLELNTVAASMRGVNDDHIWRNTIKNFQNGSTY